MSRLLMVAAAFALAVGCSSKKPDDQSMSQGDTGASEFSGGTGVAGGEIQEPERVRELGTIYFDYDRSTIRQDARPTLKANAQAIQARPDWLVITLEGHADERGSEEYNLALGERRATTAKRYLVDLGVPGNQIQTVSFGESAPAVQGHDESAWRWNRRVEFRVTR